MEMAAVYIENACAICQVVLDINRTAKGNEWLELPKVSNGLETVLDFCELSKYLSITYFIYLYYLLMVFVYRPHVLIPQSGRQVRVSGA